MNRQNVMKWCREFSKGRTDVHDEQRSRKPSLISDNHVQETEGKLRANRRVAIRELHHIIPKLSKTTIHEAVTEKLGYRKLCARWVPKILTDDHKTKRVGFALGYIGPSAVHSGPYARDFHLFLRPKKHLAGEKFDDDDEAQEEVMAWFKGRRQTSMNREY